MELNVYDKMNQELKEMIENTGTEHPMDISMRTGLILAQGVVLKHMMEIRKEIYDKIQK